MQMVIALDGVVRQFVEHQRVHLLGILWVDVCQVDDHHVEPPFIPLLHLVALELVDVTTFDASFFVVLNYKAAGQGTGDVSRCKIM